MANKTLKLGDKFTCEEVTGDAEVELILYDMVIDDDGDKWAIGIDNRGLPYTIQEDMIDPVREEHVVFLPSKGRK